MRKQVTKEELNSFVQHTVSHTTLQTNFGDYSAIVVIGNQDYLVETEALNPESPGYITEVSRETAEKMIVTDYRTVTRY